MRVMAERCEPFLTPEQLREFQRAIAEAAVDRLLSDMQTPPADERSQLVEEAR